MGGARRYLFVVPPLTGHVNPTVAVAESLVRRGGEVAWVGHPGTVGPLLPSGARLLPLDDRVPVELREEMLRKARATRGLAALKFLWDEFLLPLAETMIPGVDEAVGRFHPDLLVVDQQTLAGAIVARRRGLPWVTFATTSAGVTAPLAGLPRVAAWLESRLATLQREAGLEVIPTPDLSPHAVVVFSTEALVGPTERFPRHFHFVGPSLLRPNDPTPFPFESLDRRVPRVLVSLGTVNAESGRRFYEVVVAALAEEPLQVVIAAPPELVGPLPTRWIAQRWVPQLRLLPEMNAIVGHGGHNTTCEALAHGLPLVLAPIRDDQPVVAEQVVAAGAGVRVRFGRVTPEGLRAAVLKVLFDPSIRSAANRIQGSFARAGGAEAAAHVLERIP